MCSSGSCERQLDTGAKTVSHNADHRILVVEDDLPLARLLQQQLEHQPYIVMTANDGESAARVIEETALDLVILDLNLPRLDGLAVLQRIRPTRPSLPVLVLTARSRVEEKVLSLDTGADDCMAKPFSFVELLARIRALLRRSAEQTDEILRVGDLTMDRQHHKVERGGRLIELTAREFDLLKYLMQHAGCPVSRSTLMERVWNANFDPTTNLVDVYIKYVRDKVDGDSDNKYIRTVRGVGYMISDE